MGIAYVVYLICKGDLFWYLKNFNAMDNCDEEECIIVATAWPWFLALTILGHAMWLTVLWFKFLFSIPSRLAVLQFKRKSKHNIPTAKVVSNGD